MKQHNSLAQRYAQALFELSLNHDKAESIGEQLEHFRGLLEQNSDLRHVFVSPTFSPTERQNVIRELAKKSGYDKELLNFLNLLIEKKRSMLLPEIQESFQGFSDQHYKRLHVYVTVPTQPSDNFIAELSRKLKDESQREIILHTDINPSLLGGIVVRIGDKMLDGSLQSRIEEMKEGLLQQI